MTLALTETPDIISTLPGGGVRVAFAAETENLQANATAKLTAKRAHFIVANDVTAAGSGFGTETNGGHHLPPRRRGGAPSAPEQVRGRARHPRSGDGAAVAGC